MELRLIVLFVALFATIECVSRRAIENKVSKTIRQHKVMLFSKTYCPYSRRLKEMLSKYQIDDMKILELDLQREEYRSVIQDYLKTLSGRRTVPQLFINGIFVGGSDDTREMDRKGQFKKILIDAGVLLDERKR
ncbi:unnamed protein product, partial [Mesorhabditis belari]|uniref:Glutaredoxin domain-containing protein n=1 Tax=Mesorhabditis belari TaxID=2138241 RepID=A0AAF3F8Z5_9BILA